MSLNRNFINDQGVPSPINYTSSLINPAINYSINFYKRGTVHDVSNGVLLVINYSGRLPNNLPSRKSTNDTINYE
jgi:hypothetical protein